MGSDLGVRLLWIFAGGFLLGVFARSISPLPYSFSVLLVVLAIASSVAPLGVMDGRRMRILFVVALIASSLGITRMNGAILRGDSALTERIGKTVEIEGVVADDER